MVSPIDIVESVVQFFDEKFKADFIKCIREINYESLKNAAIFCREVEISQVLINLINNAIYAAKENKNKEAEVKIGCTSDNEFIYITIEDSGDRISKEIEEKMFEPFFTTKQNIKATGLGLSISLAAIEQYQGTIFLDHTTSSTKFIVKLKKDKILVNISSESEQLTKNNDVVKSAKKPNHLLHFP